MKKFFTLIAAVAMAASMNAQTAKVFTENTFLQTSQANVQAGIAEGWIVEGSGKTAANGKKGSIDPQTKEEKGEGAVKLDGIGLKKDNSAKAFKMAHNREISSQATAWSKKNDSQTTICKILS